MLSFLWYIFGFFIPVLVLWKAGGWKCCNSCWRVWHFVADKAKCRQLLWSGSFLLSLREGRMGFRLEVEKGGGAYTPHVTVTSSSGVFSSHTSLGTGSFQLVLCPETWISRIQQKYEGEGTSAPMSFGVWGSQKGFCDCWVSWNLRFTAAS